MNQGFGELTDVDLREAWQSEPADFTPWLAENLHRLSSALEIDPPLELIGTEKTVEEFWADIVAQSPADGKVALIENQLERSDHTHLGQVLTYLAGTEAKIVIWVAREFAEGHLSAVRWLNDYTSSEFAFFAVRVRVVRIAESPLAPLFDVLERPSDWERTIRSSVTRQEGEHTQPRREFWAHYAERYPHEGIPAGHMWSSSWVWIESAKLYLARYVAQETVGVYVRGQWDESLDEVRERIQRWEQSLRDKMSLEIGEANSWRGFANRDLRINSRNPDNWPEMAEWLHKTLADYRRVLESPPAGATATLESGDE